MNRSKLKYSTTYSVALIAGSLGAVVTMIIHPEAHNVLGQPEDVARRYELISILAHSLALISFPVIFFGFLGFSRRIGLNRPLVSAALIGYGFGGLAGSGAAVINGLVAPAIMRRMNGADPETQKFLHLILTNNALIGQSLTKIFVVASSLAIVCWSVGVPKLSRLARVLSVIGYVIGALGVIGILSGHLRLNVHGFGLLIFGQTFWIILAGVLLYRLGDEREADRHEGS